MSMFCYQCEQTAHGTGCTMRGVCGKRDTTAQLQDAIVQTVKEIGYYNNALRQSGKLDMDADRLTLDLLFATVTNVDFDDEHLNQLLQQAKATAERLQKLTGATLPNKGLIEIPARKELLGEDLLSQIGRAHV